VEVGLRGFRSRLDLTVRSGLSAGRRPPVTRSEQGDHKEHDSHRDDRNPHPHGDDMVLGPKTPDDAAMVRGSSEKSAVR
jgi:hypothetical protein